MENLTEMEARMEALTASLGAVAQPAPTVADAGEADRLAAAMATALAYAGREIAGGR